MTEYRFEIRTVESLTQAEIHCWAHLGRECLDPIAYLCPEFIFPATTHLSTEPVQVAWLSDTDGKWLVAAVIEPNASSMRFPFAASRLYSSKHSFQSGLLVSVHAEEKAKSEDSNQTPIVGQYLSHLLKSTNHNLFFSDFRLDTKTGELIRSSLEKLGAQMVVTTTYQRAFAHITQGRDLKSRLSSKRRKSIRRDKRMLERKGVVDWEVRSIATNSQQYRNNFLDLEDQGWKKEQKTSIRSNANETKFFNQCIEAFSERDEVFFTELFCDSKLVAMTVNFVVQRRAFGFKVGRNEEYSNFSVGNICEIEFFEPENQYLSSLDEFDSGSQAQAFRSKLWPDEIPMAQGYITDSKLTNMWMFSMNCLRGLKVRFTRKNKANSSQAEQG